MRTRAAGDDVVLLLGWAGGERESDEAGFGVLNLTKWWYRSIRDTKGDCMTVLLEMEIL